MSNGLEIEFSPPNRDGPCPCCGGTTVRLTRFVYRNGDAHAVYFATYSNNHENHEIAMLVSLGEWGDGSDPTQRVAFYCRVRPTDTSYEVMLGDGGSSPWGDAEVVGKLLSQAEARVHPWKASAFEILDEAVLSDRHLKGYLKRVECGDPTVPLEYAFAMPDELFELDGEVRKSRAHVGRAFAVLDDVRYFVRCLVPINVEGQGEWSPSLWLEISPADFKHARAVWDDAAMYAQLRFDGVTANSLEAVGLPVRKGVRVAVGVGDTAQPPRIVSATDDGFEALLRTPWSRDEFEQYAVERGFL